jgi:pyrroline-5-carboxylate reductase
MPQILIVGPGNIGCSIAKGLSYSIPSEAITMIGRDMNKLAKQFKNEKYRFTTQVNAHLISCSVAIFIALPVSETIPFLIKLRAISIEEEVKGNPFKLPSILSVAAGISLQEISLALGYEDVKMAPICRTMINVAASVKESITCYAGYDEDSLNIAESLCSMFGTTMNVNEDQLNACTVIGACGIAFFLRMIRAVSQGGVQIGFHPHESIALAAKTCMGAAALLCKVDKQSGIAPVISHPEEGIDRVTTPKGCTIVGLNKMENKGMSSSIIQGIVASDDKIKAMKLSSLSVPYITSLPSITNEERVSQKEVHYEMREVERKEEDKEEKGGKEGKEGKEEEDCEGSYCLIPTVSDLKEVKEEKGGKEEVTLEIEREKKELIIEEIPLEIEREKKELIIEEIPLEIEREKKELIIEEIPLEIEGEKKELIIEEIPLEIEGEKKELIIEEIPLEIEGEKKEVRKVPPKSRRIVKIKEDNEDKEKISDTLLVESKELSEEKKESKEETKKQSEEKKELSPEKTKTIPKSRRVIRAKVKTEKES